MHGKTTIKKKSNTWISQQCFLFCCFVRTLLTSSNQTVKCRIYNIFDIKSWLEEEEICFPNRDSNVSKLLYKLLPIPVAARSKAWVCGRSLVGIVGSNPGGCMDVCLLWVSCVVRKRSLRRTDHSSREVLPTVVCLCVIVKPRLWGGPGPLGLLRRGGKKIQTVANTNISSSLT